MSDPKEPKKWWRRPLVYTLALVVALAAGATTVFLVGSSNRRADRAALVAYERALLPAVREGGRIVQQEMKPTLREIAEGGISPQQVLERAGAWERVFEKALRELVALEPPVFLGDIESGWSVAMGGYLVAVDAFKTVARADAGAKEALLNQAITLGERADDLFDRVASVIQSHRRRLGLGPSGNLPDPSPTVAG